MLNTMWPDRCGVPEGRTDVASDPAFDISAVEFNESEECVECCVHEGRGDRDGPRQHWENGGWGESHLGRWRYWL